MNPVIHPSNEEIALLLDRVAALLEAQDGSPYRVRAYRRASREMEQAGVSVADLALGRGERRLEDLPHIGRSIAGAVKEFVHTGRLGLLDRLEGQISPEDLFTTVPGIGEKLAGRIHGTLGVETLEDLEVAAHDGRLASVPGIGERRARGIRETLDAVLSRSSRRRARRLRRAETGTAPRGPRPGVALLLEVDEAYRSRAGAGTLRTVRPRRFNPDRTRRLPILHAERDGWHLTAHFSNTARAHDLGRNRDWVIVYYERDGHEDQCTVVTEASGPLAGKRVVRGRERECREHYSVAPA